MLVRCPDCGKKVSAAASSCPHCGAPVKELRRQNPPEDSSASAPYAPGKGFDFAGFLVRLIKGILAVCAVLLILVAILFFAIRADLFGFRSGLRKIADSDSGTGSRVDNSNSRVMFKYYLGAILDSVEGIERKAPSDPESREAFVVEPESKTVVPKVPEKKTEPRVLDRVERKPIELPPPPPQD